MESLNPHSSNPSSDIKKNSVRRRAVRITLDIVTRPERPVRRARDIPTTVIAKTGYSTAHTGLRVLGMPPPSSRSEVSIESDLGLVSKFISSGHSIGIPLSLILCHLVRKPKPGKVNLSLLYLLMCSSVPNLNLSTLNTKKISIQGGVEATRSWKRDCFLVDAF